jgi:zinc transporter, ZIP family
LVFGSSFSAGFLALSAVIFIGYLLQNVTEGFPIASPFVGQADQKLGDIAGLFMIGAVPTVIGGVVGFYYDLTVYSVIFDGVAIGSIVYVIIPMIKSSFRSTGSPDLDYTKQKVIYIGILLGFVVGFLVNII